MSTLRKRWNAETPTFWKKVQRVAIAAGAVAGIILTAPVSLPAVVVTVAGYVAVAGTVAMIVAVLLVMLYTPKKKKIQAQLITGSIFRV
jgi:hypothetical protein